MCVCVCARVCLRTHTAGNIRPRPPLCCRQAHLIRSQVGAQPIRTELEFPLACHSALSAVTSHGPLNGRPQTQLNGLMRPNTPTETKSLKLSVFSCLCHSGTYIQVHDNDTLWHIWLQCIFYSDYLCECIFSFKVFCINDSRDPQPERAIKIQYSNKTSRRARVIILASLLYSCTLICRILLLV